VKGWDRKALEGLPLKLLIMSLLISLTVPVVLESIESYERSTTRSMMVAEGERVVSTVEEVMSAGEGNRRIITVSLPQGMDRYHLAFELGGELNGSSSLTVRCTADGKPFRALVPENPPARITSADGGTLRLMTGEHQLSIECVRIQERTVAVVEAIE
jgi:hypothetical protein